MVDHLVLHDPGQPGLDRGLATKAVKRPEPGQQGILNQILGQRRIAHPAQGKPVEVIPVVIDPGGGIRLVFRCFFHDCFRR